MNRLARTLAFIAVTLMTIAACIDGVTPDCSSGKCGEVPSPPDAAPDVVTPAQTDAGTKTDAGDARVADAKTDGG